MEANIQLNYENVQSFTYLLLEQQEAFEQLFF